MLLAYLRLDPAKIWKWNKPSKMSDSWKCRPRSSLEKGWAWKIKYLSFKVYITHFLSLFLSVYPVTVALDRQKCLVSWPHTLISLTLGGHKAEAAAGSRSSWGAPRDGKGSSQANPGGGAATGRELSAGTAPGGPVPPGTAPTSHWRWHLKPRGVLTRFLWGRTAAVVQEFGFPEDQMEILRDELNLSPQDLEQQPSLISSLNSQRHVAFHLLNPL